MKKNQNKKGFTIVELVIVIAVIAILATVLIPTFAGVIEKANKSAAMQAARNEYEMYLAENAKDLTGKENFVIESGKYWFEVKEGQFDGTALESKPEGYTGKVDLTLYQVKSVKATKVGDSSYKYDVAEGTELYKDEQCTGTAEAAAADKVAYYQVPYSTDDAGKAIDLGNTGVAIYAK